jgi:hypothetical protein
VDENVVIGLIAVVEVVGAGTGGWIGLLGSGTVLITNPPEF